jgi:hypothetical protein
LIGDAPAGVKKRQIVTPPRRPAERPLRYRAWPSTWIRGKPIRRMSLDDFQSADAAEGHRGSETRIEARQQEDRQHLWQYALALMVLLLAAEGIVASRTA